MSLIKPRHASLATLLSFLLPGWGQLYNGQWAKAVWLSVALILTLGAGTGLVALCLPVTWLPWGMVALLGTVLLLWGYAWLDALLVARRLREYALQPWQRGGIYLLVVPLLVLSLLLAVRHGVRTHWVETFLVPSQSMEPTLLRNEFLFADKRYNRIGAAGVQRGDIAIFIYPNDRSTYFIKRVIGLPGDKIKIRGADVMVNGKTLRLNAQPVEGGLLVTEGVGRSQWQVFWRAAQQQLPQTELLVPPGEVFVLGDNRTGSNDSRFFSTVPLRDVVAKAYAVLLSVEGNRLRWERMGRRLQ